MTVLISGNWFRSYKRVTSNITVLIIGTWGRSYKSITSDIIVLISGAWVSQLPLIKTVMSEVTRL
jgi:hypothetical protein